MQQGNNFRLSASRTDSLPRSSTLQQNSWWTRMKYSSAHICKWPSNTLSKWPPMKRLALKWNSSQLKRGSYKLRMFCQHRQAANTNRKKSSWTHHPDSEKQMRSQPVHCRKDPLAVLPVAGVSGAAWAKFYSLSSVTIRKWSRQGRRVSCFVLPTCWPWLFTPVAPIPCTYNAKHHTASP